MTPFCRKKKFWLILVALIGTAPAWTIVIFGGISSLGENLTIALFLVIPLGIFTALALFVAGGTFDFINSRSTKPAVGQLRDIPKKMPLYSKISLFAILLFVIALILNHLISVF
jgi:hypothetical protein